MKFVDNILAGVKKEKKKEKEKNPRCQNRNTFRAGFKITRTIFSYCEKCLRKTQPGQRREGREEGKGTARFLK